MSRSASTSPPSWTVTVGVGLRHAHPGRVEHGCRPGAGHRCEGPDETLGVVPGDVAELGQAHEHGIRRQRLQDDGGSGERRAPRRPRMRSRRPLLGSSFVAGAVEHSACAASRASRTTSGGGTITASSCMRWPPSAATVATLGDTRLARRRSAGPPRLSVCVHAGSEQW